MAQNITLTYPQPPGETGYSKVTVEDTGDLCDAWRSAINIMKGHIAALRAAMIAQSCPNIPDACP